MPTSWKDVLDCKKQYGHSDRMFRMAQEAGYNFFAWNEKVYLIYYDAGEVTFRECGLTSDLK